MHQPQGTLSRTTSILEGSRDGSAKVDTGDFLLRLVVVFLVAKELSPLLLGFWVYLHKETENFADSVHIYLTDVYALFFCNVAEYLLEVFIFDV